MVYLTRNIMLSIFLMTVFLNGCGYERSAYGQIASQETSWYKTIAAIPAPDSFTRKPCDSISFGHYLKNLSLKTTDNEVILYNGEKKVNQSAQFAVVKMDVGTQDLQQCADAVMRLRGEYLFKRKKYDVLHFNFLNDGKARYFKEYAKGDYSYKKFRSWMNYIFSYANTASLIKEMKKVNDINAIEIGDVFIKKGNPYGHAVIVVDLAVNSKGEKMVLLAQSYMPAQEIHVLNNPENKGMNPWYNTKFENTLITPEYIFSKSDLYRFP